MRYSTSMMTKHDKYFSIISKAAEAVAPVGKQRLASILVYKNEIIAMGYNQRKSHPFQKKYGTDEQCIYLHSEVDCIRNALRSVSLDVLSKCTMYVYRAKHPDYQPDKYVAGLAKPCAGCQRCIAQFGIKKVYYSTDDGSYDML